MRGKAPAVVAAIQAREIIQPVPCAAKTVAVSSAGKHGNCRYKNTACFTSEKRALALTCSLRTVWTTEGVSWTVYTNFLRQAQT